MAAVPIAVLLLFTSSLIAVNQAQTCADVASCRQAALEAADRKDFEAFHDLAWRAAQKGRPNDPELMLLLARAQSLSGRPGDALVMIRRLAEMGVATDAIAGEDFRRVRGLAAWPDVEAMIAAAAGGKDKRQPARLAADEPSAPRDAAPSPAAAPSVARADSGARVAAAPADPMAAAEAEATLHLAEPALDPIGLAYDSASRRFVVGDRHGNKLIVADEVFKRVNGLIGALSAGFGTLTAVEVDRRRGDLWVTSVGDTGGATLHKLQLVSGRVLSTLEAPDDWRPVAFNDIAVTNDGAVLLIDGGGSRLVTVAPGARRFGAPLALHAASARSLAASGARIYVAHAQGLTMADAGSGQTSEVRAANGVMLTGLRRIRWHRGGLVGIQEEDGGARLVRIRVARSGTRATAIEVLDGQVAAVGAALAISGDAAYYLATSGDGPIIRRVRLR